MLLSLYFNYQAYSSRAKFSNNDALKLAQNQQSLLLIVERLVRQRALAVIILPKQNAIIKSPTTCINSPISESYFLPINLMHYMPIQLDKFIQFADWLQLEDAIELEKLYKSLQAEQVNFNFTAQTLDKQELLFYGRIIDDCCLLYCQLPPSNANNQLLLLNHISDLKQFVQGVEVLFNRSSMAIWLRDKTGKIRWVNSGYRALANKKEQVKGAPYDMVAEPSYELFGKQLRQEISKDWFYKGEAQTVINGRKLDLRILAVQAAVGEVGVAFDISYQKSIERELEVLRAGQLDVLEQLSSAVAIFDHNMRLKFYNQAFLQLWELTDDLLKAHPSHSYILDQLRMRAGLDHHLDWNGWKKVIFDVYHSNEVLEQLWYLPGGKVVRVLLKPQLAGGVIWLFENLTEKVELETRYNNLLKIQNETLDNLSDAVAVFGADGKLKLINKSFIKLWNLPAVLSIDTSSIFAIAEHCTVNYQATLWNSLCEEVVGVHEVREIKSGRLVLEDEQIFTYLVVPLSGDQTMITFVNITDSLKIERVLKERNSALEVADRIRNDFVHYISYHLRSPLTNIIGFTQLLERCEQATADQLAMQYVSYIAQSSQELLALVNDILDLERVDAGALQLAQDEVNVRQLILDVQERLSFDLQQKSLRLKINIAPKAAMVFADLERSKQVIFHLLKNAINYSRHNGTIYFTSQCIGDEIILSIADKGTGIDPIYREAIFERFQSYGKARGAGLGLAIAKTFMDLHAGRIWLDTNYSDGAKICCAFKIIKAAQLRPEPELMVK